VRQPHRPAPPSIGGRGVWRGRTNKQGGVGQWWVKQNNVNGADSLLEEGSSVILSGAQKLFGVLVTGALMNVMLQWVDMGTGRLRQT
jgi:hypothetical protein